MSCLCAHLCVCARMCTCLLCCSRVRSKEAQNLVKPLTRLLGFPLFGNAAQCNRGLEWQTLSVNCQRVTCAWLIRRKFCFTTYFTLYAKWWNICTWVETAWWDLLQEDRADGGNTLMIWWVVLSLGTTERLRLLWRSLMSGTWEGTTGHRFWIRLRGWSDVWLLVRAGCWIRLGGGTLVRRPRITAFQVALGLVLRRAFFLC